MTIKMEGWKFGEKVPYPLFVSQEAVYVEDAKGHPIALVDVEIASLVAVAPKMQAVLLKVIKFMGDWKMDEIRREELEQVAAEARGEGKQ